LTWAGWSGGHAVPGDLGLRRPPWRWMSVLTVNTSDELCSPIALRSHRIAFWLACPQNYVALPLQLPTLFGFLLPLPRGSTSRIFSTGWTRFEASAKSSFLRTDLSSMVELANPPGDYLCKYSRGRRLGQGIKTPTLPRPGFQ